MAKNEVLTGELLDDVTLTLRELAEACHVEEVWVVERVNAGIIQSVKKDQTWHFVSADLIRAKKLLAIERSFDADAELAALVTDLIEEIAQLKQKLRIVERHVD
jgi:chaperone modulatory protein CbpM